MKKLLLSLVVSSVSLVLSAQTVTNLNNAGPGSLFANITSAQPGDSITFSSSLLNNGSDTIHFNSAISINKGLTIIGLYQGGDTLYLDGQNLHQLFYIDLTGRSNEFVHLEDLAFVRGLSSGHGGGVEVLNTDSLVVRNCLFKGNRQIGSAENGGGIRITDSRAWISGCDFIENAASGRFGGGCRVNRSEAFVQGCRFIRNEAGDGGGGFAAIYSTYKVEDCLFAQNRIDTNVIWGGAGLYSNVNINSLVRRCEFTDNHADHNGAGAYFRSDTSVTVDECYFRGNSVANLGGSSVHCIFSSIKFSNCTFARNQGGKGFVIDATNVHFENSTFYNNRSTNDVDGSMEDSATFKNCSFIRDSAPPGVFLALSSSGPFVFTLKGCLFNSNGVMNIANVNRAQSLGHNSFDQTYPSTRVSDQFNVSLAQLDLGLFQKNGGFAPTILPGRSSPTVNSGSPNLFTDAQNGPIWGIRDIGSAETPLVNYDTILSCDPVTWWGNTYAGEGIYTDTAFGANSPDSAGVLVITSVDTSASVDSGMLVAGETSANTTYQWLDCDDGFSPISGATSSSFTPSVNGSYAVQITNGSCIDTSACLNYNQVSLTENNPVIVQFYPNPTRGTIHWKSDFEIDKLMIIDLSGREVASLPVSSNAVQLPSLSKGLYLLRWEFDDGKVQVDRVVLK
ncbi:MAG: right-handed parallel beta-helix repeat-containing protein [Flavobacteriia bacterium]|nr:right-handed parallel beta-helix repeat-containing protein [Flavobacteriia bacterium]